MHMKREPHAERKTGWTLIRQTCVERLDAMMSTPLVPGAFMLGDRKLSPAGRVPNKHKVV